MRANPSTKAPFQLEKKVHRGGVAQPRAAPDDQHLDFYSPASDQDVRAKRTLTSGAVAGIGMDSDASRLWPAYYDGTDWYELGPHVSFDVKASASCSQGYGQFGGKTWPQAAGGPTPTPAHSTSRCRPNPTVRRDSSQIIDFLTSTIATVQHPDFLTTPRNGTGGEPTHWVHSSDPTWQALMR
jgi:hypothetical protein